MTSQTAVTRVRHLLQAAKAGHTGTLDPLASGLLPVCLGDATKFAHDLLEADKRYLARIRFGIRTTTGDLEGDIVEKRPVEFDRRQLLEVLGEFFGKIKQIPPMYSALKKDGRPLYDYARKGISIEREPRDVEIKRLELLSTAENEAEIDVICSKGTYIRVLAEDIGARLGCGATLASLRRTEVGPHSLEQSADFALLESASEQERLARLLPVDVLVRTLPKVDVSGREADRFLQGQSVMIAAETAPVDGLARIYRAEGEFLGLGDVAGGQVAPRKLLASDT